ncbi:hypothetical protein [Paraburkholderia flagellata]|uniref:hypothetical protein n=1 Tax=Paraburkholderia flagellata TaxID=2883241 RepID=UPI001F184B1D|nr:hypothetical protein [Paraburkholderia flagellata]
MNRQGAYQKKARNMENVKARFSFLKTAIASPHKINASVAKSLISQRTFCSLQISKTEIYPISLNTFKSLSRELYSTEKEAGGDGFAYLDAMRVQLRNLVEDTTKGRSVDARVKRREEHQSELADRISKTELQNIYRSKAYFDLYSKLKSLVSESAIEEAVRLRLLRLLKNHDELYGSLLSPQGSLTADTAVLIAWPTQQEEE